MTSFIARRIGLFIAGFLLGAVGQAWSGQLSDGAKLINIAAAEHGEEETTAKETAPEVAAEAPAAEAKSDEVSAHEAHGEEPKAEEAKADAHGEAAEAHGGEHGGEAAEVVEPPPPPLWPETAAVEPDKQPYILIRSLRAVQDEIASGSVAAHEKQRTLMRDLGVTMSGLPAAVWDDVRNVRAAIFYVLSGGSATVLNAVIERGRSPFIERRLLKGTLAYGQGRTMDALGLMQKLKARDLDPLLSGIVALIQGTLITKKDPAKAIALFDEARLLSPGTLVEEAALRQQILLLARDGQLERFDFLTAQYARRFPNSLFARGFRRQIFAGVARQSFKRTSEWISRTETELMRVPASERVGLYLAIAEEATKGGNIDIARFAAGKARELAPPDSRSFQRATLFEGAALAATDDFEKGLTLLDGIDETKLASPDLEIRDSARAVAGAVGRWPVTAAKPQEEVPQSASVSRAEELLSKVDTMLGGS